MEENSYIQSIISGLGLAINEKNNTEFIINYPINYDKKNMKFTISSKYKIISQSLGTFLADFLNTDFEKYDEFFNFFIKYSLSVLNYNKLIKTFKNGYCLENKFNDFVLSLQNRNKNQLKKLQEQTDMILDYCLLSPNKRALGFEPIERLYVLTRTSPILNLLTENKSSYYSTILFSSYPGKSEKEIYDFISKKKNKILEYDLILPYDISSILYKSITNVLKGNVYLKICKNCNQYFIATNKAYNYCDNIAPGETKTCRTIGRRISFKNAKENDSVLDFYYKVYNRKSTMKSRNPDIEKYSTDFVKYKETGKKKVSQYKNGKLDAESFKNWIKKNS